MKSEENVSARVRSVAERKKCTLLKCPYGSRGKKI